MGSVDEYGLSIQGAKGFRRQIAMRLVHMNHVVFSALKLSSKGFSVGERKFKQIIEVKVSQMVG